MDKKVRIIFEALGASTVAKESMLVASGLKTIEKSGKDMQSKLGLRNDLLPDDMKQLLGLEGKKFNDSSKLRGGGLIKDIDNSKKMLKGFQMEYLSTMFMGMQVWRTFGGFFRSMLDNYKALDKKGQQPLSKGLVKLSASFQYFKFQVMDAMGSSLLPFITKLADALLWLADLDDKTLAGIGYAIGAIAVTGLIAFTGSQIKLFADAITGLVGKAALESGGSITATTMNPVTVAMAAALGVLAVSWKFNSEEVGTAWEELKTAIFDKQNSDKLLITASIDFTQSLETGWGNFLVWMGTKYGELLADLVIKTAEFGLKIVDLVKAAFNKDWDEIKEIFGGMKFSEMGSPFIVGSPESLVNGWNTLGGVLDGINNRFAESGIYLWESDTATKAIGTSVQENVIPQWDEFDTSVNETLTNLQTKVDKLNESAAKTIEKTINITVKGDSTDVQSGTVYG